MKIEQCLFNNRDGVEEEYANLYLESQRTLLHEMKEVVQRFA